MENRAVVERIMKNLAFDLETVPKAKTHDNTTTSSKADPLNLKITVRKKDSVSGAQQQGFISNIQSEPKMVLQKIRLVNSDKTIMSFDMYMEAELQQKPNKKSRKRIFEKLSPGLCLGAADDDDHLYMPEGGYSGNVNESSTKSKSDVILGQPFSMTKNTYDNFSKPSIIKKEKSFLGRKCKPGGCLDPPFDEDIYAYKPRMKEPMHESKKTEPTIVAKEMPTNIKPVNKTSQRTKTKSKEINIKSVDDKVEKSGLLKRSHKAESSKNSVITYPPDNGIITLKTIVASNSTDSKIHKSKPSIEYKSKQSRQSVNESMNSFFSLPKGTKVDSITSPVRNPSIGHCEIPKTIRNKPVEYVKTPISISVSVDSVRLGQNGIENNENTDILPMQIKSVLNPNDVPEKQMMPFTYTLEQNGIERYNDTSLSPDENSMQLSISDFKNITRTSEIPFIYPLKVNANDDNDNTELVSKPLQELELITLNNKVINNIDHNEFEKIISKSNSIIKEENVFLRSIKLSNTNINQNAKEEIKNPIESRVQEMNENEDKVYSINNFENLSSKIKEHQVSLHEYSFEKVNGDANENTIVTANLKKKVNLDNSTLIATDSIYLNAEQNVQVSTKLNDNKETVENIDNSPSTKSKHSIKIDMPMLPNPKLILDGDNIGQHSIKANKIDKEGIASKPNHKSDDVINSPILTLFDKTSSELKNCNENIAKIATENLENVTIVDLNKHIFEHKLKSSLDIAIISDKKTTSIDRISIRDKRKYSSDKSSVIDKNAILPHRSSTIENKTVSLIRGSSMSKIGISPDRDSAKDSRRVFPDRDSAKDSRKVSPDRDSVENNRVVSSDGSLTKNNRGVSPNRASIKENRRVSPDKDLTKENRRVSSDIDSAEDNIIVKPDRDLAKDKRGVLLDKSPTRENRRVSPDRDSTKKDSRLLPGRDFTKDNKIVSPDKGSTTGNKIVSAGKTLTTENRKVSPDRDSTKEDRRVLSYRGSLEDNRIALPDRDFAKDNRGVLPDSGAAKGIKIGSPDRILAKENRRILSDKGSTTNNKGVSVYSDSAIDNKIVSPDRATAEDDRKVSPDRVLTKDNRGVLSDRDSAKETRRITPYRDLAESNRIVLPDRGSTTGNKEFSADNGSAKDNKVVLPDVITAEDNKTFSPDRGFTKDNRGVLIDRDSTKGNRRFSPDRDSAKDKLIISPDRILTEDNKIVLPDRDSAKDNIKVFPDRYLTIENRRASPNRDLTKDNRTVSPDRGSTTSNKRVLLDREIIEISKRISPDRDHASFTGSQKTLRNIETDNTLKEKLVLESVNSTNDLSTISLYLAFHSYVNKQNERIINTVDVKNKIRRYPNDSLIFIKSQIKLNLKENCEFNIPIDSKLDMAIEIKQTGETSKAYCNQTLAKSTPKMFETDAIRTGSIEGVQLKRKENDSLSSTLTNIYEQELVPLQTIIRDLKQEIDTLNTQRIGFKKKVLYQKKAKPRLSHSNKSCN